MDSVNWRKATYSGTGGGDCIEVGHTDHTIMVRDTKNRSGLVLAVPAAAWQAFAQAVKHA